MRLKTVVSAAPHTVDGFQVLYGSNLADEAPAWFVEAVENQTITFTGEVLVLWDRTNVGHNRAIKDTDWLLHHENGHITCLSDDVVKHCYEPAD